MRSVKDGSANSVKKPVRHVLFPIHSRLFLQTLVKPLETFDPLREQLRVAYPRPLPPAQNRIDPNALIPLEFPVLQVSVVDHLRHHRHRLVRNPKPLDQRFKRAIVAPCFDFTP